MKSLWLVNKDKYFELNESDGLKKEKYCYVVNNRNDIYSISKIIDKYIHYMAQQLIIAESKYVTVYQDYIKVKGFSFIKNNNKVRIYVTDDNMVLIFLNVFEHTV